MALSDKRGRFVEEYLLDLNATQAATRAGYSPDTARQQGSRLLSDPDIQAAIEAAQKARSRRTEITADRVVQELALIAFADMGQVTHWTENSVELRPSHMLSRDQKAIIGEIAQSKDGVRVKTHSKLDALSKLGQHLGMFKTELSNNDDGPLVVQIIKRTYDDA
jgi:phage terminase small subunit